MKMPEKRAVRRSARIGMLILAFALLAVTVWSGIEALTRRTQMTVTDLYSYTMTAGSGYKVHLRRNELYPEGGMEEGRLYARALVDHLQIDFDANFGGTQPAEISGRYEVTAVLRGYQGNGENRQDLYERSYPLVKEKPIDAANSVEFSESISLEMKPYTDFANMAEQLLGARLSRELHVVFSGVFVADTAFGQVEEPFTQVINIPLTGDLFTLSKQEAVFRQDRIAESKAVPAESKLMLLLPAVGCLLAGAACLAGFLFFTRDPDAKEQHQMNFQGVLRKHGSRMIRLASRPAFLDSGQQAAVVDLDDLVKLSDEMQQPIFYRPDPQGHPVDGMLYVSGKDGKLYFLHFRG